MTRTPDQIVAEFDALNGWGEGHFIDEMETEELKLLINRIEALEAALRMLIDNVETGSYESTGQAIDNAKQTLPS